jgi:hypothetical protein
MDASSENIGPAGVKLIAEALRASVTGGLTSIDLSRNQLCGIWSDNYGNQRGTYTAEGITAIADALGVDGGLTSLNLSSNQLCGLNHLGRGTYTAEGITAIADALRVNGACDGLTATIAATAFAPIEPMPFFLTFSDASLVSLLLWMASQTALTPSSLRLLDDKSRAVSPPLTRKAWAIAVMPSAV